MNVEYSELNVLFTGLIMVFFILIILILAIKFYSYIVLAINNKFNKNYKSRENRTDINKGEISDEIIAVISASVYSIYHNETTKKIKIKSIRKAKCDYKKNWGILSRLEYMKKM